MARLGKRERKELRERKKYEHALRLAQFARIDRVTPDPIRTSFCRVEIPVTFNLSVMMLSVPAAPLKVTTPPLVRLKLPVSGS